MKKLFVLLFALVMITGAAIAEGDAYQIVCPSGAPALTVAALKEHVQTIGADAIAEPFSKEEADFIIAPVNAGAKLYKAGKSTYRLAAVVTWGNLVFASQLPDFTLESMNGKSVTLFGENTINAAIALYILGEKGITPSEITYLAGAKETQEKVMSEEDAIVMTAEPVATVAKMKNEAVTTISLSDVYQEITGENGFAQAGLFVRQKTVDENPEKVNGWIDEIRAAAELCESDPETVAKAAVEMEILANEKIVLLSIGNCHIRFVPAKEAKEQIEKVAAIDLTQFGGAVPADDFYYETVE